MSTVGGQALGEASFVRQDAISPYFTGCVPACCQCVGRLIGSGRHCHDPRCHGDVPRRYEQGGKQDLRLCLRAAASMKNLHVRFFTRRWVVAVGYSSSRIQCNKAGFSHFYLFVSCVVVGVLEELSHLRFRWYSVGGGELRQAISRSRCAGQAFCSQE